MVSCGNIILGSGLIFLGSIFTWKNEANQVCTRGAYEVASASTHELKTCTMDENELDSFMHLTCPVEESLITSESSTGIAAKGAYKLTFLTEQYGYVYTSETQMKKQCDTNGYCTDKTQSCSCLKLDWTTSPVTLTSLIASSSIWCDRCSSKISNMKFNIEPTLPNDQTLLVNIEPALVNRSMAEKSINEWLTKHPEVKEEGWEWKGEFGSAGGKLNNTSTSHNIYYLRRPFKWGNTPPTKLGSAIQFADHVPLGDGTLKIDGKHISSIKNQQAMPITTTPKSISQNTFTKYCSSDVSSSSSTHYYSSAKSKYDVVYCDDSKPSLGDLRMTVQAFGSKTISALGKQVKDDSNDHDTNMATIKSGLFGKSTIPPCKARSLFYATNGQRSASEIYESLQSGLETQTQIFRFLTFILIGLGFHVALSPIQQGATNIPIIGSSLASLVGFFLHIFTALLTASIWFTVFALAWVFYRPGYGILFLALAGCFSYGAYSVFKKSSSNGGVEKSVQEQSGDDSVDNPGQGIQMYGLVKSSDASIA